MPQPGQGEHGHHRRARCLRVLELTEQVAAATLLAANQGVWLRARQADARPLPPALARCTSCCWPTSPGHRRPRPGRRPAPVPATYRPAPLEAACVTPGCFTSTAKSSCRSSTWTACTSSGTGITSSTWKSRAAPARAPATTTADAASGYHWPVIDLQLRYVRGAVFGQR
jgi:hypothetical protein